MQTDSRDGPPSRDALAARYGAVRSLSERLAAPLSPEDQQIQSMDDASPTKWHLAHITWFFETFLLKPSLPGYAPFRDTYEYLFNSYYEGVGPRHARPRRGMLTRPPLAEILDYRAHVDRAMARLIATAPEGEGWTRLGALIALGLNHEQQHQELLLTDIEHALSCNPLAPAYREDARTAQPNRAPAQGWVGFAGGIHEIGHEGPGFAFDNEGPRHRVLVEDFRLATRCVTNGEWREFIEDGGYRTAAHWLSDGWTTVQREGWDAPLYWRNGDGAWRGFGLDGLALLDDAAPVSHVSYYEADAYARWAGKRLPTEAEWEIASVAATDGDGDIEASANLLAADRLRPVAAPDRDGLAQMIGDVWEWTQSAYSPYPGFRTAEGAVGEYNGKFMVSQQVLRGGSCYTPPGHIRATYRNFFYPQQRWQQMGLRLAEDG